MPGDVDAEAEMQKCSGVGAERSVTALLIVLPRYLGPLSNVGKKDAFQKHCNASEGMVFLQLHFT